MSRFAELGISFIGMVIIANALGTSDFGAVSLGSTILTVSASILSLGLSAGISRMLPRYEAAEKRIGVVISAYELAIPAVLLASSLMYVYVDVIAVRIFSDASLVPILKIFITFLPFAVIFRLQSGTFRGEKQTFPKAFLQGICLPSSRILIAVGAILTGAGVVGVAWGYAASYAITALGGLYFFWKSTSLDLQTTPDRMHYELISFSLPLIISVVMGKILQQLDTFLLGVFQTTDSIGIYTVSYQLALVVTLVSSSANYLLTPLFSEFEADKSMHDVRELYQIAAEWIVFATLPILLGIVIGNKPLLTLLFGIEFSPGASSLVLLAAGFFLSQLFGPTGSILTAFGKTRQIMYANIGAALLNLLLNIYLIPRYSYFGAAVATVISYTMLNATLLTVLSMSYGIHPFNKRILLPTVGSISVAGLVLYIFDWQALLPRVLLFMFAMIIWGGGFMWLGGFREQELEIYSEIREKYT